MEVFKYPRPFLDSVHSGLQEVLKRLNSINNSLLPRYILLPTDLHRLLSVVLRRLGVIIHRSSIPAHVFEIPLPGSTNLNPISIFGIFFADNVGDRLNGTVRVGEQEPLIVGPFGVGDREHDHASDVVDVDESGEGEIPRERLERDGAGKDIVDEFGGEVYGGDCCGFHERGAGYEAIDVELLDGNREFSKEGGKTYQGLSAVMANEGLCSSRYSQRVFSAAVFDAA